MGVLTVRAAHAEDLAAIAAIENMSFPSPWDTETFETTIEDRRCISVLAFENGMLAGYCIALCLTSMVHILNLAVHPEYRRRGIGKCLVKEVLRQSVSVSKVCAVLEVRKSNKPARSLYASLGFTCVSTWHGYYSDNREDAAIMVKDLRSQTPTDVQCTVMSNEEVADRTFHLMLEGTIPSVCPGQFVMVQVSSTNEPFLRRPLAVLGQKGDAVELLYKVKGAGTGLLCRKKRGECIKVLGPLGRGFTIAACDHVIYLAGGTGIPPVLAVAEKIEKGTFILGAKSKSDIPLLERVTSINNTHTIIMTEDGSWGDKGLATDALHEALRGIGRDEEVMVYACGPEGMLRRGVDLATGAGVYCEISLEERMSCGFGACAGCVVNTRSGKMRVCREGPVFAADEVVWG